MDTEAVMRRKQIKGFFWGKIVLSDLHALTWHLGDLADPSVVQREFVKNSVE